MKLAGSVFLAFFVLSVISVAHSAILDTFLNTAKEVGYGAQKLGDDVLGAFVLPTAKCKHGPCSGVDKMKVLEEHNVEGYQMQPNYVGECILQNAVLLSFLFLKLICSNYSNRNDSNYSILL